MTDEPNFGEMVLEDRGGEHDFHYEDARSVAASKGLTPSQTIGPFFAYGLTPRSYRYQFDDIHSSKLVSPEHTDQRIVLEGQIFDGEGVAVHDALVEIIQADANGMYAVQPRNDGFTGYGRMGTGALGKVGDTRFVFETVKPGRTAPDCAPFVALIITMRGLLNHCVTRVYFPDDVLADDPVMTQVPQDRRHTLVAKALDGNRYKFDIHMQGENETVFFDV